MKCDKCGKSFRSGNSIINGMPNGVTMVMQDGKEVTLCQRCIMTLGKLSDEGRAKFFESMGIEAKK